MPRDQCRIVVVEDDVDLAQAIARAVVSLDPKPDVAGTVTEALLCLQREPSLIVCDIRLPDGSGLQVAEVAARMRPMPSMIAISGTATPEEAFALARFGVSGYLQKPLVLSELRRTIDQVLAMPPDLEPLATSCVGRLSIHEVQGRVRRAMVEQALALSDGNRTDASRLLQVTRQAVQQMVREMDLDVSASSRGRH
jgi:two-component system, response regulator RegA